MKNEILKALKNEEEFSVGVANDLQNKAVQLAMRTHGLQPCGSELELTEGDKYVHYYFHQGFWCTSCLHPGPVFNFEDFILAACCADKLSKPVNQKPAEVQQEVKYKHFRKYKKVIKMSGVDNQVSNLGGFTLAFHECPNDEMAVAMAFCCDEDNFNREVGRQVSRKRLFSRPFLMMDCELEELLRMSYDEVLEHPEFSSLYDIAMGRV